MTYIRHTCTIKGSSGTYQRRYFSVRNEFVNYYSNQHDFETKPVEKLSGTFNLRSCSHVGDGENDDTGSQTASPILRKKSKSHGRKKKPRIVLFFHGNLECRLMAASLKEADHWRKQLQDRVLWFREKPADAEPEAIAPVLESPRVRRARRASIEAAAAEAKRKREQEEDDEKERWAKEQESSSSRAVSLLHAEHSPEELQAQKEIDLAVHEELAGPKRQEGGHDGVRAVGETPDHTVGSEDGQDSFGANERCVANDEDLVLHPAGPQHEAANLAGGEMLSPSAAGLTVAKHVATESAEIATFATPSRLPSAKDTALATPLLDTSACTELTPEVEEKQNFQFTPSPYDSQQTPMQLFRAGSMKSVLEDPQGATLSQLLLPSIGTDNVHFLGITEDGDWFMRSYATPGQPRQQRAGLIQTDFLDVTSGQSVLECPPTLSEFFDNQVSQPTKLAVLEAKELQRRSEELEYVHNQVEKASSALRKALDSSLQGKLILMREAVHQCKIRRSLPAERQWLARVRAAFDHFDRRNTGSVNFDQFLNGLQLVSKTFGTALEVDGVDLRVARTGLPSSSAGRYSDSQLRNMLVHSIRAMSAVAVSALFQHLVNLPNTGSSLFADGGHVSASFITTASAGELSRIQFCRFFGGPCPALPAARVLFDETPMDLSTAAFTAWVMLHHFFDHRQEAEHIKQLKAEVTDFLTSQAVANLDASEEALLRPDVMSKIEGCDISVARKQVILETEERMLFTSIESFRLRHPVYYVHPIDKSTHVEGASDVARNQDQVRDGSSKLIQTPAKQRRLSLRGGRSDSLITNSAKGPVDFASLALGSSPRNSADASGLQRRMSFSPSPRASSGNDTFQRRLSSNSLTIDAQGGTSPAGTQLVSTTLPSGPRSGNGSEVHAFSSSEALSVAQTKQVLLLNTNVTSLKKEQGSKLVQTLRKSLSPRSRHSNTKLPASKDSTDQGGGRFAASEPEPYLVVRRCVLNSPTLNRFGKSGELHDDKTTWHWEEVARTSRLDSASLSDVRSWRPLAIPLQLLLGYHDEVIGLPQLQALGPVLSETLLSLELEVFDARNDWSIGHTRLSLLEVLGVEEMILLMAEHKAQTLERLGKQVEATDLVAELVCQLMPEDVDIRRNVLFETDLLSRKRNSVHGGLFGSMMVVKETSVTSSRRRHIANVKRQIRTSVKEKQADRERRQREGELAAVSAAAEETTAKLEAAVQHNSSDGSGDQRLSNELRNHDEGQREQSQGSRNSVDSESVSAGSGFDDTSDGEPEETVEELLEKIRASIRAARTADVNVAEFERIINELADAYEITDESSASLRETRSLLEARKAADHALSAALDNLVVAIDECAARRTAESAAQVAAAIAALRDKSKESGSENLPAVDSIDTEWYRSRCATTIADAESLLKQVAIEIKSRGTIARLEELLHNAETRIATAIASQNFLDERECGNWIDQIATASQAAGQVSAVVDNLETARRSVPLDELPCIARAENLLAQFNAFFHFQRAASEVYKTLGLIAAHPFELSVGSAAIRNLATKLHAVESCATACLSLVQPADSRPLLPKAWRGDGARDAINGPPPASESLLGRAMLQLRARNALAGVNAVVVAHRVRSRSVSRDNAENEVLSDGSNDITSVKPEDAGLDCRDVHDLERMFAAANDFLARLSAAARRQRKVDTANGELSSALKAFLDGTQDIDEFRMVVNRVGASSAGLSDSALDDLVEECRELLIVESGAQGLVDATEALQKLIAQCRESEDIVALRDGMAVARAAATEATKAGAAISAAHVTLLEDAQRLFDDLRAAQADRERLERETVKTRKAQQVTMQRAEAEKIKAEEIAALDDAAREVLVKCVADSRHALLEVEQECDRLCALMGQSDEVASTRCRLTGADEVNQVNAATLRHSELVQLQKQLDEAIDACPDGNLDLDDEAMQTSEDLSNAIPVAQLLGAIVVAMCEGGGPKGLKDALAEAASNGLSKRHRVVAAAIRLMKALDRAKAVKEAVADVNRAIGAHLDGRYGMWFIQSCPKKKRNELRFGLTCAAFALFAHARLPDITEFVSVLDEVASRQMCCGDLELEAVLARARAYAGAQDAHSRREARLAALRTAIGDCRRTQKIQGLEAALREADRSSAAEVSSSPPSESESCIVADPDLEALRFEANTLISELKQMAFLASVRAKMEDVVVIARDIVSKHKLDGVQEIVSAVDSNVLQTLQDKLGRSISATRNALAEVHSHLERPKVAAPALEAATQTIEDASEVLQALEDIAARRTLAKAVISARESREAAPLRAMLAPSLLNAGRSGISERVKADDCIRAAAQNLLEELDAAMKVEQAVSKVNDATLVYLASTHAHLLVGTDGQAPTTAQANSDQALVQFVSIIAEVEASGLGDNARLGPMLARAHSIIDQRREIDRLMKIRSDLHESMTVARRTRDQSLLEKAIVKARSAVQNPDIAATHSSSESHSRLEPTNSREAVRRISIALNSEIDEATALVSEMGKHRTASAALEALESLLGHGRKIFEEGLGNATPAGAAVAADLQKKLQVSMRSIQQV